MSAVGDSRTGLPIFKAVSSSARPLFQLLNCIRFASKAQVQISSEGLRFAVEESRVMQGIVFLDKALFTSFNCSIPIAEPDEDDPDSFAADLPNFQISLSALLETLQIFGAAEAGSSRFSKSDNDGYISNIRRDRHNAFSNQALGISGVCRLSYAETGSPFSIILEETGVTTTCNLNTYDPENQQEIPFQRNATQVKVIMQARWLYDAVSELSSTAPSRLDITASPTAPYLSLSAVGHLGRYVSVAVHYIFKSRFSREFCSYHAVTNLKRHCHYLSGFFLFERYLTMESNYSASVDFAKGKDLLETFTVPEKWTQSYKFDMIKAASEAMRLASKVSVRGDEQGVLSLQFMVEVEGGGISFVDFRFVPFLQEEDEDGDNEDDEDNGGDETEDDQYEDMAEDS